MTHACTHAHTYGRTMLVVKSLSRLKIEIEIESLYFAIWCHTQIGWVFAHICTPESVTIEPLYSADKTKTFSQLAQLDRGTCHAPPTCHVVTCDTITRWDTAFQLLIPISAISGELHQLMDWINSSLVCLLGGLVPSMRYTSYVGEYFLHLQGAPKKDWL